MLVEPLTLPPTPAQAPVLVALAALLERGVAPSHADIATLAGRSRSTVSSHVCALIDRGLVIGDGRRRLRLTEAGARWFMESRR